MSKIDNEIKEGTPRFKKGDAFVGMAPHPLVFMEVNEVEGNAGNKDFCIVTWYSLDEKGINAQRRFPLVAVDGEVCNFEPISRKLLKEAKSLMRQFDVEAKQLTDKKEAKSLLREYTGKWLAEQLGVSTTTTSRWCSNASQPDLQTLNKIAKVLNVSMKDLLADNKIE